MGTKTNNYNLIKPAPEDFYNIQDYNDNMDIIDGQLKEIDSGLGVLVNDYVRQPGYGVTAGSENTYTLVLSPAPTAYKDGIGVVVKMNVANSGACTLNVNGLGAKAIVDSKGNALTAGKLRVNGIYSLRYDGTNFVLLGEAIEGSGSKLDADLLDGKEASAFATAAQGIKADAAATQTSFNAHTSDATRHKQVSNISQTGLYANAEGYNTTASGDYSHAECVSTEASGRYSHAEGAVTTASGEGSHAEGHGTSAIGNYSHAEGANTKASEAFSHTEGNGTEASGNCSHAEGQESMASGWCSHSEGYCTDASYTASHSEGYATSATGEGSHSEGQYTLACVGTLYTITAFNATNKSITLDKISDLSVGNSIDIKVQNSFTIKNVKVLEINGSIVTLNTTDTITSDWIYAVKVSASNFGSHTEGYNTIACGYCSHGEGAQTTASGYESHAEGYWSKASGNVSHAEGQRTTASGDYSHAEGYETSASGIYSHAEGHGTSASMNMSHAEGDRTTASGYASHAEGFDTIASGDFSHTEGKSTKADGQSSHAEGKATTASGICSHAEGLHTTAIGSSHSEGYDTLACDGELYKITGFNDTNKSITLDRISGLSVGDSLQINLSVGQTILNINILSINELTVTLSITDTISSDWKYAIKVSDYNFGSHAEGYKTTASGYFSHAEGSFSNATGSVSHAEGCATNAIGVATHAEGMSTIANNYISHAMGVCNKTLSGNPTAYSITSDAFVIGNGIDEASRSNAFRVTFDGRTYGLSAFNSTGADYAEFFEWADGNIDNEDRVGYFVTLDGDKIRKAISTDDYILGVVSVNPSVIGDNHADDWSGKYVTDKWGRIQCHNVIVPATYRTVHHDAVYEENTDKIITDAYDEEVLINEERTDFVPRLNPDWDSSQEYISREKRKEWSAVGMMGKLLVRDDGTCKVNGFCKPNDAGIATTALTGYRVMKRVSEKIIQILVK